MKRILLASTAALLATGAALADDVRVIMKPDAIPTVRVTDFRATLGFNPLLPEWNEDSGFLTQEQRVPGLDPEIVVHLWDAEGNVLISSPGVVTAAAPDQAEQAFLARADRRRVAAAGRLSAGGQGGDWGTPLATDILDGTHVRLADRVFGTVPLGWRRDGDPMMLVDAPDVAQAATYEVPSAVPTRVMPPSPTVGTDSTLLADQLRVAIDAEPSSRAVPRREPVLGADALRRGSTIGGLDGDGVRGGGWENPALRSGLRISR